MPDRDRLMHLLNELRRGLMEEESAAWMLSEATAEAMSDALDHCRQIERCILDLDHDPLWKGPSR